MAKPDFNELVVWIEEIRNEIWVLNHDRQMWVEIRDRLLALYPDAGILTWFDSYTRLYVTSATLRCRRIATDADSRSISLVNLLKHLCAVSVGTFVESGDRWRDNFDVDEDDPLPDQFGEDELLDPNRIAIDSEALENDIRTVGDFASKVIAHANRNNPMLQLTYDELDAAVGRIGDITERYFYLLRGSQIEADGEIAAPNWKFVFRNPIFPLEAD